MSFPHISLVSFGDRSCRSARRRLRRQARQSGYFDSIYVWNERNLEKGFRRRNKSRLIHGSRGFGYWVWKPQVILQALERVADGGVLVYVDAGCHIAPGREKGMRRYINKVMDSETGILCGELKYLEAHWAKGDLLDFLDVRYQSEIVDSGQRMATVLFFRKGLTSLQFVHRWAEICERYPDLLSDKPSVSPNLKGFRENRHDQAVLSILSKLFGADVFPAKEVEMWRKPSDESTFSPYPIEARRDRRSRQHIPWKRILKLLKQLGRNGFEGTPRR